MEGLTGLVDVGDDLFVGERFYFVAVEQVADLCAICGNAGRVAVGDEGQLGIHKDVGPDVDGAMDGVEDGFDDFKLRGIGLDGFDSG